MSSLVRPLLLAQKPSKFLGAYSLWAGGNTGVSPAQNATFFSMRWAPAVSGVIAVVRQIELRTQNFSAWTAGSPPATLGVIHCSGFTEADSGGTVLTPFRKDSGYPASLMADARFISGSSLTQGTRSPNTVPLMAQNMQSAAQTGISHDAPRYGGDADDPIVLRANEGLLLNHISNTTGGAFMWGINVHWIELASGVVL